MDKRELEIVKCRCGKKPDLVDRKVVGGHGWFDTSWAVECRPCGMATTQETNYHDDSLAKALVIRNWNRDRERN